MALVSKSTKTGGTTSLQDGQVLPATDINTDSDTLFNLVNGNIDNDNIKAGAAIAYSKLTLTSSIVNGDLTAGTLTNAAINASAGIAQTKIDDISAADSAHDDVATPGDSETQTLPTTLQGEVQQLRYTIERLALGLSGNTHGQRVSASGSESVGWFDLPARNMVWLPGFNGVVTSGLPSGWANHNTATLAQEAADAADPTAGKGRAIKITASGSANEGISYTLSGLKASTRYLIVAIVKATAGDTVKLVTSGADGASSFRELSGADGSSTTSTTWAPIWGVVQTDSTPTDIVVRIVTGADGDIVWVAHVGYAECSAVPLGARVAVVEQQVAATAGTAIDGSTTDAGLDANYQFVDDGSNDLDKTVYVPGDGYYIRVTADFNGEETTATQGTKTEVTVRLYQSVAGAALSAVREHHLTAEHDDGATSRAERFSCSMTWIVKAPTPGASYRYALAATITGNPTLTPQKGNVGESALTVEVVPYGG